MASRGLLMFVALRVSDMSKALQHLLVWQVSGGSVTCPRPSSTCWSAKAPEDRGRVQGPSAPAGPPRLQRISDVPKGLQRLLVSLGSEDQQRVQGVGPLGSVSKASLHLQLPRYALIVMVDPRHPDRIVWWILLKIPA